MLLLKQPPRDVPGIELAALTIPSQRIDGDFYEFFTHENQTLDVIVADVMGKGIPAALLAAATKSTFLEAINRALEPDALVQAIRTAAVAFAGSDRLTDDLTCVAVKMGEAPRPLVRATMEMSSAPSPSCRGHGSTCARSAAVSRVRRSTTRA